MTRLIDADALAREMYHKSFEVDDGRNVWNSGLWIRYKIFEEAIIDAPIIDAVQVIRCKDCRWYDMSDSSGTVEPIGYRCKKVTRLWREPAYIFNSNNAYIREILRKKHVQLRPENGIDVGKIKALHRAGWTVTAIAFEMCLDTRQITEVLQGDK